MPNGIKGRTYIKETCLGDLFVGPGGFDLVHNVQQLVCSAVIRKICRLFSAYNVVLEQVSKDPIMYYSFT